MGEAVKIALDTIAFMRGLPGFMATGDAENQPTAVENGTARARR